MLEFFRFDECLYALSNGDRYFPKQKAVDRSAKVLLHSRLLLRIFDIIQIFGSL